MHQRYGRGKRSARVGSVELRGRKRTFSIYHSKPISCNREIPQCIDSSDVRQRRDSKVLSGRERLATGLGLVLERVQTRDDPGSLLVWWRGLYVVSQRPKLT